MVQETAWCMIGAKPLPEPMWVLFVKKMIYTIKHTAPVKNHLCRLYLKNWYQNHIEHVFVSPKDHNEDKIITHNEDKIIT